MIPTTVRTLSRTLARASVGVLAAGMLVGMAAPASAATYSAHPVSQADQEVAGVFEVTGSGTAITIDTDPSTQRFFDVPLGWSKDFTAPADVDLLQVVVVGGDNVGCRIIFGGRVVAEEPPGGSAHCIYAPTN